MMVVDRRSEDVCKKNRKLKIKYQNYNAKIKNTKT
jgi:hypothetical protein